MRARKFIIDPSIWDDSHFGQLSSLARVLFFGLLGFSGRDGLVINNPRILGRWIFPYDEWLTNDELAGAVADIVGAHLSVVITQRDGEEFVDLSECEYFRLSLLKEKIPREIRDAVLARDGARCLACGSTQGLAADHIVAESRGGPTVFENLQTLCSRCNSRKRTRTIDYRRHEVN